MIKKLEYNKFRAILGLTIENKVLSKKLEEMLDGKVQKMSQIGFLKLLFDAKVEKDIYSILTGEKAGFADTFKVLKVLFDFFGYLLSKRENWSELLSNLGLSVEKLSTIPMKGLKKV